jgi:thiamine pyrophosphate-dependent acetolactate synthase large subunit-like protein
LEQVQRPLVIVDKGIAWLRAEDEVRAFIERTQIPFLRSRMGKGVMPDDHPLSVAAARTLALQNADVVFLMGARFNWIFRFAGITRGYYAGITVTVHPFPAVPGFSLDVLDPEAAPLPQAIAGMLDAAQKTRVTFELVIQPIALSPEADQRSGRLPVAGDDNLLAFGFAQKPREVVPDLGQSNPPHTGSPKLP